MEMKEQMSENAEGEMSVYKLKQQFLHVIILIHNFLIEFKLKHPLESCHPIFSFKCRIYIVSYTNTILINT